MTIQVVEISLAGLAVPAPVVEADDWYVYEHLKRYCSKFRPLPAAMVALDGDHLIVVRGRVYVSIARDLGEDRIRAVLEGVTFEELRDRRVDGILTLVSSETLASEWSPGDELRSCWHIFFFKSDPNPQVVAQIDSRFRSFLRLSLPDVPGTMVDSAILSSFDVTGPCFEIRFPTPADRRWAASYLTFVTSISNELCAIETYQGTRFGPVRFRR
jgi:hypothetical protein